MSWQHHGIIAGLFRGNGGQKMLYADTEGYIHGIGLSCTAIRDIKGSTASSKIDAAAAGALVHTHMVKMWEGSPQR